MPAARPPTYRFGKFQVDPREHELRRDGTRIKIQEQSFLVLVTLLERPGELVTREELCKAIWPADTFVDFETGLNKVIKRLREALGDNAEAPTYIETAPKLGYRFIAPVEWLNRDLEAKRGRPNYYAAAVLCAVVAAVGGLAFWKAALPSSSAPRVLRFTALTNDGQVKEGPLVSDGSRIYFNEVLPGPRGVIVQVSVKGGAVTPLAVPLNHPHLMDISKDGTEILVADSAGEEHSSLWLQPLAGGSPRRVGNIFADEAQFASGGNIIYSVANEVHLTSREGSSSRRLFSTQGYPHSFRFAPDEKTFRFSVDDDQIDVTKIMEAASDGSGLHEMFPGSSGNWTSDGKFFSFESSQDARSDLWALPEGSHFFATRHAPRPLRLTAGPMHFLFPVSSRDSKQIFAIGKDPRAEVIRYDRKSDGFVPYFSGISAEGLAYSRDGKWVTYTSYPSGTLWRSRLDGSERLQLTFAPLRALLPRWSPDGKRIAFNGALPGQVWNVYVVSSDGGTPMQVSASAEGQTDASWSPDGNSLMYGATLPPDAAANAVIRSIDLRAGRITSLPGSNGFFSPRWSPDGKHIAALTLVHPTKLMVFDVSKQKWSEVFVYDCGYPNWSVDGSDIYVLTWKNPAQYMGERVVRIRLSDRKADSVVDLEHVGRLTTGTITEWFGLAPDDSPLFARDISTTEIYGLDMDWP